MFTFLNSAVALFYFLLALCAFRASLIVSTLQPSSSLSFSFSYILPAGVNDIISIYIQLYLPFILIFRDWYHKYRNTIPQFFNWRLSYKLLGVNVALRILMKAIFEYCQYKSNTRQSSEPHHKRSLVKSGSLVLVH